MQTDNDLILDHLNDPIFHLIGEVADEMNRPCFVIGGYVRDIFLDRPSKDIDIVTLGSGIELAEAVTTKLGKRAHLSTFRNFGTAQVKYSDQKENIEIEFVGARKESYSHDSRKPIVEDGSLQDDQNRRDFTINALALCLNKEHWGMLVDPFDGMNDLKKGIIRTPLDPDITFSDDPLRVIRAIRLCHSTKFSHRERDIRRPIERNRKRIEIISKRRIIDELGKIIRFGYSPSGIYFIRRLPELLLYHFFPKSPHSKEQKQSKDEDIKTIFIIRSPSSTMWHCASRNEWLRSGCATAAIIGKPRTKRYDSRLGWTFHNHNFIGEKMIPGIFRKMKLPLNEKMKYVQKLVGLHMRPIVLAEEVVTDSAVRRLLFNAGDDIDDLMLLCESDITSKNREKVKRFRDNFELVRTKLREIEEKDSIRNMKLPIRGEEIMETFGLPPSRPVGEILSAIKEAILDGKIPNEYEPARLFMLETAATMNLFPTKK